MAKLWQKDYELNELVERFTVGRDYILDNALIIPDCTASIAHARMLNSIGLLTDAELDKLENALKTIISDFKDGNFTIKQSDEDCHTAIENYLTVNAGAAGKKIHTGRSRNDQVQTALRMYSRASILSLLEKGLSLAECMVNFAETNKNIPMPGRTHMQIAMPSSIGLWAGAWAEEVVDSLKNLISVYALVDHCPLGAAASYGTPLPLNREMTAELLGFAKVQNNVLYVNNSRGRLDSLVLNAVEHIGLILSSAAQDLILFSLPEFGYFSLPAELCTGSSIMPQKKNPDGLELMRAKSATISSCAMQVKQVVRSLPSGYNRDFQETKEPYMNGLELAAQCIEIMDLTFSRLQVNRDRLEAAFTPEIYATDVAIEMVAGGASFRDAYKEVGLNLEALGTRNPAEINESRSSTGTTGKLGLDKVNKDIADLRSKTADAKAVLLDAVTALAGDDVELI
ncbi:MAG: argininosuccinate lyase [Spirochaetales bacterium]|uniref:Argininosuccinate lyase n=1 Tax=Candidatus Thalassospirochaeta sargassi TaxID=3119039 RepID=A0AAJ1MPP6_9SPIO|nr:argininosuccinate lyase [Spirochaetales bacterium]